MNPCPWCSCTLGHEPGCLGDIPAECRRDARASIEPDLNDLQRQIYAALRQHPRTCDAIEADLGMTHQTASARVHELAKAGLIVPEAKRPTRSGRMATVWRAAR